MQIPKWQMSKRYGSMVSQEIGRQPCVHSIKVARGGEEAQV